MKLLDKSLSGLLSALLGEKKKLTEDAVPPDVVEDNWESPSQIPDRKSFVLCLL